MSIPYSCIISPRFSDTDAYSIMHHASYYFWFEEARFRFAQEILGFDERSPQDSEIRFPVIESACRYRAPVRHGDRLRIELVFELGTAAKIRFSYKAVNDRTGQIHAQGHTLHVFSDSENRILFNVPQWLNSRAALAVAAREDSSGTNSD